MFFALFSLVFLVVAGYLYIKIKNIDTAYIPPARISNNISFNDKLQFANGKTADHVAIGSSMTLYNLHSKPVTEMLGNSYLNLASWGQSIEDSYLMLQSYSKIHTPKTVIISTNLFDFCQRQISYNDDEIHPSLSTSCYKQFYFRHPEVKYYLDEAEYYKTIKSSNRIYETLLYDGYGAVYYANKLDTFIESKWNDAQDKQGIYEQNYVYLDSISSFAKHNNILLFVFQSPFREGLLDAVDIGKLSQHTQRIATILAADGHLYIDATKQLWADSLYADGTHLNRAGAMVYTQYCLDRIRTEGLLSSLINCKK